MAINFNDKTLVTNPTVYYLGRGVLGVGILAIIAGAITHFTGELLIPAAGWCVFGLPPILIGIIMMKSGLTKN
jgi:hypothetical protein